jgi:hypothetical protein
MSSSPTELEKEETRKAINLNMEIVLFSLSASSALTGCACDTHKQFYL